MAKIGKGHFRWEQNWGDYDIFYSSKDKQFYTDANKLFPGAGEFFESMINSQTVTEEQKRLHLYEIHHGVSIGMKQISANTQKELEDSVNLFNRLFVTTETSESKVILYRLEYKTETQSSTEGMRKGEVNHQEFTMGFKYRIAMKKTLGENILYSDNTRYNNRLSKYDISGMKEVAWTQELEDFIISFSKTFDGLIDKMKPFFETEGRIMELIGRNILMP